MSAYVVNKSHINAMIQAGLLDRRYGTTWFHNGEHHKLDERNANEVGQMLLDENIKAVGIRYQDSPITDLPGMANAEYLIPFAHHFTARIPKAVELIKVIQGYEYQASEDPDYKKSEAHAFCQSLKDSAIDNLPGYDDAPWEWEDEDYYKTDHPVRLV